MPQLAIPVETPHSFADIDFVRMAEHFGGPIDIITDLEGTVIPWGRRVGQAAVAAEVTDAIADAACEEAIVGAHGVTNRGGREGRALTAIFTRAVHGVDPALSSYGQSPNYRSERKPSGLLSNRVVSEISVHDYLWPKGLRQNASELIIAFVGDKLSDMLEAEQLHKTSGLTVVGFFVERHGNTDHPLDTVFGKRRQATAKRNEFASNAPNNFVL
jgi:hypothetical protein